jgi:hypothetical protein
MTAVAELLAAAGLLLGLALTVAAGGLAELI